MDFYQVPSIAGAIVGYVLFVIGHAFTVRRFDEFQLSEWVAGFGLVLLGASLIHLTYVLIKVLLGGTP